ncbi:MAG: hypothetical protein HOC20_02415 [Chloroflexi bacterium]|nr:hypothetical protein [Chloroflexota bacterium]
MSNAESDCKMCGECCQYEIPITILDIHRMREYLTIPASIVFEEYIQKEVSARSGLFMITKNTQRECVLLNSDKQCSMIVPNAKHKAHVPWKPQLPWTIFNSWFGILGSVGRYFLARRSIRCRVP